MLFATQKRKLRLILKKQPRLDAIIAAIWAAGGRTLLVGGAVRDLLLGRQPKDIDIEIYGLKFEALKKILAKHGTVLLVGKSFGVLKITRLDVDFSLPRADSSGRKPQVAVDPDMDFKTAFGRRDVTINAIGIDLRTFELVDPYHGQKDLTRGILRAPDPTRFEQDPLRFYRVMQLVGRFDCKPDRTLTALCKKMSLDGVSRERIEQEFAKLFLKSDKPSLGIDWLRRVGRLAEIMPELVATIGVEQGMRWHPEGDVYEHTMQAIDAAAGMKYDSDKEKLIALWTMVCHDLGKVSTSVRKPDGGISAHGHEIVSVKLAKKLLRRITHDRDLIDAVCTITRHHMMPGQLVAHKAKPAAYKRLALKISGSASMALLGTCALADKLARNPARGTPLKKGGPEERAFLRIAKNLNVLHEVEKPILLGRDLLDVMAPGPAMGAALKKAYAIQLEQGIYDKDELRRLALGD